VVVGGSIPPWDTRNKEKLKMDENVFKIKDEMLSFLRGSLDKRISLLTDAQLDLLFRMYGNPIPDSRLEQACDICDRTLNKRK